MKNNIENDPTEKSNPKFIIISVLIIAFIVFSIFFLVFLLKPKFSTNYEVTFEDTTKEILTLQVITEDTTGKELIRINDELLKKYNKPFPTVYIFYFDDKLYTADFFTLFPKANLTQEEHRAIMHNVAMYYSDKGAVNNCLSKRLDIGWNVLKCY